MSRRIRRAATLKLLCGLVAAVLALSVQAGPAAARDGGPVRSGTILGGYTIALGPVGCSLVADCAAWLASQCDARLAGQDPAVFTSIVEVSDLAGSYRHLSRPRWMTNTAEFWSGDCRRLGEVPRGGFMSIPQGARWLTITASVLPHTQWALW